MAIKNRQDALDALSKGEISQASFEGSWGKGSPQGELPEMEGATRYGSTYLQDVAVPGAIGGRDLGTPYDLSGGVGGVGSGGGGSGGGGSGGGGSGGSTRESFFTPSSGPQPGELDYNQLMRGLTGRGGNVTDLALLSLQGQQATQDRLQRYEEEKFSLIGEQKNLAGMDEQVKEYMRRQGRESVRGAQSARGMFASGAGVEEEAYIMPQIEQGIQNWQLQALRSISQQIDPLIAATSGQAIQYNYPIGG